MTFLSTYIVTDVLYFIILLNFYLYREIVLIKIEAIKRL